MARELSSLTAFVTGGASGIGLATVRALADGGARVVSFDRDVGVPVDGAVPVVGDVTDSASVEAAVDTAQELFGGLDIVVNNAGIPSRAGIADATDEEWRHVLDVNVVGMARVVRAALPLLRASPASAIVNTCSVSASVGLESLPVYAASKGAIAALTRSLAADLLPHGIRVNCVNPATVATPWMDRVFDAAGDRAAAERSASSRQPTGRMVTAEEVARAITFLASPLSGSITGIELPVDGGMASLRPTPRPDAAPPR
jgi:NAD(P)-dependent dehydrogenase (short-subunit alcohol dehydrogenase family)